MNNEVVKQETSSLSVVPLGAIEFTKEQIQLIKDLVAPDATENELKMFIYQAKKTGLDPLAKQIYCVHRKSGNTKKMTIQTSIDGFRVVAERSGNYGGQDEPIFGDLIDFEYNEGYWENNQKKFRKKTIKVPEFVKVAVYKFRGDVRYCAAVGVAYWSEYYPGDQNGSFWQDMPRVMLSKVAEAIALRKAFPQDLSGLYIHEEMEKGRSDSGETTPAQPPKFEYTIEKQSYLQQLLETSTFQSGTDIHKAIAVNIETTKLMTVEKYFKIKSNLEANQLPIDQRVKMNAGDVNKVVAKKAKAEEIEYESLPR
jgi:phage recombination protein Bet